MNSKTRLYSNIRWINISRKWIYEVNAYVYRSQSKYGNFTHTHKKYPNFFKATDILYSIASRISYWIINGKSGM